MVDKDDAQARAVELKMAQWSKGFAFESNKGCELWVYYTLDAEKNF